MTELAAAKLERQNKHINDTEPSLLSGLLKSKSTSPSKTSKSWKPFDFTQDTSDDTESVTATEQSRSNSALDVHAREFRPSSAFDLISPAMSRQNSHTTADAGHGFQLVTGRNQKASTARPTGLNAYEVKAEDKPATVTAPFNKREVNDVFGNDLPTPDILASEPGEKEGQVKFIIHPNGDVSAQQWSAAQFQWHNIGQYSNIRKRTEGQLASDRLKGQTESQTLQQNTLVYFRALGKQREAAVMGLPFGAKEIQSCLPHVSVEQNVNSAPFQSSPPEKIFTTAATDPVHTSKQESELLRRPWMYDTSHAAPMSSPFNSTPSLFGHRNKSTGTVESSEKRSLLNSLAFGSLPAVSTSQPFVTQRVGTAQPPSADVRPTTATLPATVITGFHNPISFDDSDSEDDVYLRGLQSSVNNPAEHRYVGGTPRDGVEEELMQQLHNQERYINNIRSNSVLGRSGHTAPPSQVQGTEHDSDASLLRRNAMKDYLNRVANISDRQTACDNPLIEDNLGTMRQTREQEGDRNGWRSPPPTAVGEYTHSIESYLQSMMTQLPAQQERDSRLFEELDRGRKTSNVATARTVLHDPLRHSAAKSVPEAVLRSSLSRTAGLPVVGVSQQANSGIVSPPRLRGGHIMRQDSNTTDLSVSEPESGWRDRLVKVVTFNNPQPTNEQSALRSEPTRQDWHGPFFTDTHPQAANEKDYDDELRDWYYGGNTIERQDEFFRRIKDAHYQTPALNTPSKLPRASVGTIGRSSTTTTSMPHKSQASVPDFNEDMTRLLIPVLENLSSYVQGPPEKRHGYFARYAPPPEWCIDKTVGGNQSFFGEEWGKPPARIGRDSRYRPLAFEGRFGGFEMGGGFRFGR